MQFKDECEPGYSHWTPKTVSGVIKVTSSQWLLLYGHLSNTDTSLCPFGVRIREVRLYLNNELIDRLRSYKFIIMRDNNKVFFGLLEKKPFVWND